MTEIKPWEIRGDGNTLEERAGWMLTEIHELRAAAEIGAAIGEKAR